MSIATQIERLQGVRDQIRTKMVSLGLSENTDLLQNLADDLDGIAAATADDVSGSVSGDNPGKITLTAAATSGSSSTTATAKAIVTKGLYTGSSNIEKNLDSKTITATAEATLAASVSGSTTVPSTLPAGTVTITPNTDNTKRIYSDSKNKGFMTGVVLEAMPTGAYSASVASHTTTNATASSSVTGSITHVASVSKPAGTDGTDYYTITPKLTTGAGSSKATGKATIDTSGYLAVGNTTSEESSKSVGVTDSQGGSYYLIASSVSSAIKEDPGNVWANKATVTPAKSKRFVKITAGYLPNSKITVEAIPTQEFIIAKDAWSATDSAKETGSYTCTISGVTGVTASNDIVVLPNTTSEVAACGVYASAQGTLSITFKAFSKPSSNIRYTVYILNG